MSFFEKTLVILLCTPEKFFSDCLIKFGFAPKFKQTMNAAVALSTLCLPNNFTLLNTFIWKKKYVIFVGSTETRITDKIIDNNEIYSRKWFDINDIKQIIKNKNTKQTKGLFKMRNGAVDSTAAIIDFMGY